MTKDADGEVGRVGADRGSVGHPGRFAGGLAGSAHFPSFNPIRNIRGSHRAG